MKFRFGKMCCLVQIFNPTSVLLFFTLKKLSYKKTINKLYKNNIFKLKFTKVNVGKIKFLKFSMSKECLLGWFRDKITEKFLVYFH